jgi:adenine/guanine phosphoribosyltransferase-like PRPP-binding protein
MSVDMPLSFIDQAGKELAEMLRPYEPQVSVTASTLGIPVAWATAARALGLGTIIVLHKRLPRFIWQMLWWSHCRP